MGLCLEVMMETGAQNVALFIDMENFAQDDGRGGIGVVVARMKERGYRLIIKKAYADWGQFAAHKRAMLEHSIELTELPSHGMRGKNGADIKLSIDALEAAIFRDYLQIFVIVSGDSDFTPLLSKLREYNKYVIVIARKQACSNLLKGYCDELIDYDSLRTSAGLVRSTRGDRYDLLRSAVLALESQNMEVRASRVKSQMLVMDPAFNETSYGFQQFKQYLEAAEKDQVLKLTPHRDGDRGISLLGHNHDAVPAEVGPSRPEGKPVKQKMPPTTAAPSPFVALVLRACRIANCGEVGPGRLDVVAAISRQLDPNFDLVRYGGSRTSGFLGLASNRTTEKYYTVGRRVGEDHPWVELTEDGSRWLQDLSLEQQDLEASARQAFIQLQLPIRWDTYVAVVETLTGIATGEYEGQKSSSWTEIASIISNKVVPGLGSQRIIRICQILMESGRIELLSDDGTEQESGSLIRSVGAANQCLYSLVEYIQHLLQTERKLNVAPALILKVMEATDEQIQYCLSGSAG